MNTNMNYPVKPTMDNRKKICDRFCKVIKANLLLSIVSLVVVLVLFVFLMIKWSWVLWIYVAISLLIISTVGVKWMLFDSKAGDRIIPESNVEEELVLKIQSLERQNNSLYHQINTLEGSIREKEFELEQCKRDLSNIQNEFTLGNKYVNILMFIQDLDRNIEDLPESAKDFKDIVKKKLSKLLAMFGYKFLDYEPECEDLYDCEYYPIESVDIIGRTIVSNNGELVLKGKIYLPENYGTKQ